MQERVKPNKRAVNLSIGAELIEDAKKAGVNLSALLEEALQERLKVERWRAWQEENRSAIDSVNADINRHGLLSDKHRTW